MVYEFGLWFGYEGKLLEDLLLKIILVVMWRINCSMIKVEGVINFFINLGER